MLKEVVPHNIGDEEILGRIILHSYHYSESKNKILPEAFMPSPSEKNEVSTIRFNYTNIDFCKQRGLIIAERRSIKKPCKFIGVAFIRCRKVINAPDNELKKGDDPKAHFNFKAIPCATPLCEKEELRTDKPIYVDDDGIPSHADIKYNANIFEEHRPMKQRFKQRVLKPLVAIAKENFFRDKDTTTQNWKGEDINLTD